MEPIFRKLPSPLRLRADAEAEPQHEDGQVIYARNGRSTQFHFAHPPHEGRIGHADELFHEQTDQDGVGHLPYFAVGIFRMHKKRISDDGEMWCKDTIILHKKRPSFCKDSLLFVFF